MEFSRQEYWSGLPCPPPGDLPNPGIESPASVRNLRLLHLLHWQEVSLPLAPPGKPAKEVLGVLKNIHHGLLKMMDVFG